MPSINLKCFLFFSAVHNYIIYYIRAEVLCHSEEEDIKWKLYFIIMMQ